MEFEELQELVDKSNLNVKLNCKLGKGAFGVVYSATHRTTDHKLAIKMEKINGKYSTLQKEAKIMLMLKEGNGFPRARQFRSTSKLDMLVMDRLGPNLERLFKFCKGIFTLKTVLLLAEQMIDRIQFFHSQNLIHRDIKPENFAMGSSYSLKTLYMIDYGIAKLYRSEKGDHITFKTGKGLIGTARYASLNSHLGNEQSRRDDLEGIAYTLVYFLKGHLLWQNAKGATKKEKYEHIKQLKMQKSVKEICEGLPKEFEIYLQYVKDLNFTEAPSYSKLKKLFTDLYKKMGYAKDYVYDWIIIEDCYKKLPPEFYKLTSNSNYTTSFNGSSNDEMDEKIAVLGENLNSESELPYTYKLNRIYKLKKSINEEHNKRKLLNKKSTFFSSGKSRCSVPAKMITLIPKESSLDPSSNMLRIPITKNGTWKRSMLEFYTTKTMYSSKNATSKIMNKSQIPFESENSILKYSENERKTYFSGYSRKKKKKRKSKKKDEEKKDNSFNSEMADFDSDMEEQMNDLVMKKIQMLMPLEKKLINSLSKTCKSKSNI